MKKLLLSAAVLMTAVSVNAMTLREAYNEIAALPKLQNIEKATGSLSGWLEALPIQNGEIAAVAHEVGNGQTVYYGSNVEAVAQQLPDEQLVISGADFQSLLYVFASPVDTESSEVLILVDLAYQGKTYAIYGTVNQRFVDVMKQGEVRFSNHKTYLNVPLLGFD